MKTRSLISLILSSALLAACSDKEGESASGPETAAKKHQAAAVSFNDGSKWTANPETTAGIDRMRRMVSEFTTADDPSTYPKLVTALEQEYAAVIRNCTMTGEAHNQLHNFLAPLNQLIEPLKSGDPQVAKEALIKLENHLKTYSAYFE
jgi:hypothetical protein